MIPENPVNAKAMNAAQINAIGTPLNALGTGALSNCSLIAENINITIKYPIEIERE